MYIYQLFFSNGEKTYVLNFDTIMLHKYKEN